MGVYKFNFENRYCGEASVLGISTEASWEDVLAAGFIDDKYAAVKLFADGKEVDISDYEKTAREYIKKDGSEEDFFLEKKSGLKV